MLHQHTSTCNVNLALVRQHFGNWQVTRRCWRVSGIAIRKTKPDIDQSIRPI